MLDMPTTTKNRSIKILDLSPAKDPRGGGHKHGSRHSKGSLSIDRADRSDRPVPFGYFPQ